MLSSMQKEHDAIEVEGDREDVAATIRELRQGRARHEAPAERAKATRGPARPLRNANNSQPPPQPPQQPSQPQQPSSAEGPRPGVHPPSRPPKLKAEQ